MRPMYFDRQGNLMTSSQWSEAFERNESRRVALTDLDNGKEVSTVWLGLDHSFSGDPPMIFETMVFEKETRESLDCERYATEAEARTGHEAMCAKWATKQ